MVNYTSPRGATAGEAVIKSIEDAGSKGSLVQANVSKVSDLQKLVDAAVGLSETNEIDILVHNAGNGDDCYLADMTEGFYESQSDVNLKGRTIYGNQEFHKLIFCSSYIPHQSHASVSSKRGPHCTHLFCICPPRGPTANSLRSYQSRVREHVQSLGYRAGA